MDYGSISYFSIIESWGYSWSYSYIPLSQKNQWKTLSKNSISTQTIYYQFAFKRLTFKESRALLFVNGEFGIQTITENQEFNFGHQQLVK